ncbi:MAG: serine hydrolase domain-containing protein [Pseudomonadota bacterium]
MRYLLFVAAAVLAACSPSEESAPTRTITLGSGAEVEREQLDTFFDQVIDAGAAPGLSVALINDGEVVYTHVAGLADVEAGQPVTSDTLFEAASLSKPIFGALAVSLAGDGIIDLDTPLADYLPHPDLAGVPEAAVITARMVLSHQTGLPNWRSDEPDDTLNFAFAPGSSYRYSGEGYEYLADVLMHQLETDDAGLNDEFRQRVIVPAGASETLFLQDADQMARTAAGYRQGEIVGEDEPGSGAEFGAAWSVHSAAADYARVMMALMDGSVLSEDEAALYFQPQGVSFPADEPSLAIGLSDWALGFSIFEIPIGRIYAHGGNNKGYTNFVAINPETAWGFVIFTNEDQANDLMLQATFFAAGLAE